MTGGPEPPEPDLRQRVLGRFLRLLNPAVRRMIPRGVPTGAPNILLTVRGRKSGEPRTVPVGVVTLDGRRFIQSSYGETGWVRNLRANAEATVTDGDRTEPVTVVELTPDEAAAILQRVLAPFHRSGLLRAALGPNFRPPIGVLWRVRLRVDDTLAEYAADARRHPLFELRPVTRAAKTAAETP
jgi:deazaflavin-dependent oxidoreductase (nitroreductase family)